MENLRLQNELDAQKQMYERLLQDFKTVLKGSCRCCVIPVDTNDLYVNEINRLNKMIGNKDYSVPALPAPTHPPTVEPKISTAEKPNRIKQTSISVEKSNCIQEHSKRPPKVQSIATFTERYEYG